MKWIGYLFSSLWRLWFLIIFLLVFILFMPALFFFTAIIKNEIVTGYKYEISVSNLLFLDNNERIFFETFSFGVFET